MKKNSLNRIVKPKRPPKLYDPKTGIMTRPAQPAKVQTVKEMMRETLANMGGAEAMTQWALHNPGQMYGMSTRLVPQEVVGKDGGAIEITFVDPVQPEPTEKIINQTPKAAK